MEKMKWARKTWVGECTETEEKSQQAKRRMKLGEIKTEIDYSKGVKKGFRVLVAHSYGGTFYLREKY